MKYVYLTMPNKHIVHIEANINYDNYYTLKHTFIGAN